MKIFISWAGEQSQHIAMGLRIFLPRVIQVLDPWMSEEDIPAGERGISDIESQLESANFGILCLTVGNLEAPWVLFEAGALSKLVDRSYVVPFLYDIKPTDLKPPLSRFQGVLADEKGTRALLDSIQLALPKKIEMSILEHAFQASWPEFKKVLDAVPPLPEGTEKSSRSPEDMLEELLTLARLTERERSVTERESAYAAGVVAGSSFLRGNQPASTGSLQHRFIPAATEDFSHLSNYPHDPGKEGKSA